MSTTDCECEAVNELTLRLNEDRRLYVDFSRYLQTSDRVNGVTSITPLNDAGEAPSVSGATYSNDGKTVSARFDATGGSVRKRRYKFSIVVSVRNAEAETDTVEAVVVLNVC